MSTQSSCAPDDSQALGFWRRPFVQDVLPLITSLVLHLAIVALGILTYKAITTVVRHEQAPAVIPESLSELSADPAPFKRAGFEDGDEVKAFQDTFKDIPPEVDGISNALKNNFASGGGSGNSDQAEETIALGLDKAFGKNGKGVGNGGGVGTGTGDGDGLGLAPWGPRTTRPHGVPFAKSNGVANKVVFVCDSSGSMMTKLDALRSELRKAIDHLAPTQQFDVIFFAEDRYVALDRQLLYALPENKRKAYDLLEKTYARGTSDPVPGLQAAFAANPELIYLLTDGDFPDNKAVAQEVRKLESGKKVTINTIAFFDRGAEYEQLLKQIADDTRGSFRFVSEEDLSR